MNVLKLASLIGAKLAEQEMLEDQSDNFPLNSEELSAMMMALNTEQRGVRDTVLGDDPEGSSGRTYGDPMEISNLELGDK